MQEKYSIRILKKEKFSLILSGGSAYGFAHIGVIKFLEENSIAPKEIIGTSMGSIIGAFYAIGKNSKEIEKLFKKSKQRRLIGTSSKKLAKKVGAFLVENLGDRKMKDTVIPLKIVTTNLHTGKGKVFSSKDDVLISEVVLASIAIPGIFYPREIKGKKYIDGGVYSNLPIEYAIKRNIKLASNVMNKYQVYSEFKQKFWLFPGFLRKIHELEYTVHYLLQNQTYSKIPFVKKLILIEPDMNGSSQFDFYTYKRSVGKGYCAIKEYFSN